MTELRLNIAQFSTIQIICYKIDLHVFHLSWFMFKLGFLNICLRQLVFIYDRIFPAANEIFRQMQLIAGLGRNEKSLLCEFYSSSISWHLMQH